MYLPISKSPISLNKILWWPGADVTGEEEVE
jgi:hypothetical protein